VLGVWNWCGSNESGGKTALADWDSIALNGRTAYVAFDSDVMEKREVHSALVRLKGFLESRKATVKLIYLPAGEHGEKVGLDDYIAREKAAGRNDADIRDSLLALATSELRRPPSEATDRPEIIIEAGQQPKIVDDAEKVLLANAPRRRIFQRGSEIVRVTALDRESERGGLQRPTGTVQLTAVSTLNLLEVFDRLIRWMRPGGSDGPKPTDCPPKIATTYLARIGDWKLPALVGVVEAPVMRLDGTILSAPGYDNATGLYLYGEPDWPAIPERPTRAQAENALQVLLAPFMEFPFVADEDRSVLLAGILTALQRRLLDFAPLFGFSAPSQRTGKSLCAESISIIATGRKPPAMGVSVKDEELRKAITSALREGHLMINLDNITHPLGSPDLARALTQSLYADRLLGANHVLRLPTNVLWTATGNNLTFGGDMPSRALLCRLDAQMERPEERYFHIKDLPTHLLENRKQLSAAALTILRAYKIADHPRQDVKPWGGFDNWSRDIREPLVWLGLADPCKTRERIIVNDPERDSALSILSAWSEAFGDRGMLVAELISEASPELKEQLMTVAAERNDPAKLDARRLGAWCRSVEDRIFGDFRLRRDGSVRRATVWRVRCVSQVSKENPGQNGTTHARPTGSNDARESACASRALDPHEINSPGSPDSPNEVHGKTDREKF